VCLSSGVTRILVEEGHGRGYFFVVLFLGEVGGSQCPFSIEKNIQCVFVQIIFVIIYLIFIKKI